MSDPFDTYAADGTAGLPLRHVLASLHYAYPTAVFVYYMVTSTIAVCTLQTRSSEQAHPRRRAITWLLMFVILTYFAQLAALGIQGAVRHIFPVAEQDIVIGLMSCALVFGVVFAGLSEAPNPVWYPYMGTFGIALVVEPVVGTLTMMVREGESPSFTDIFDISTVAVRYLAVILALAFYFEGGYSARQEKGTDAERQSLLKTNGHANHGSDSNGHSNGDQPNGYGATSDASTDGNQSSDTDGSTDSNQSSDTDDDENPYERRQRQASEQMEKRLKEKGNWVTYAKSFLVSTSGTAYTPYLNFVTDGTPSGLLPLRLARQPSLAPGPCRACGILSASHELHQRPDSAPAGYHHRQPLGE
jgi:hypothetical protein